MKVKQKREIWSIHRMALLEKRMKFPSESNQDDFSFEKKMIFVT